MNSLFVLYTLFFISIGFEIATIIVAVLFVIPLQNKEAKVVDRLVKLRKQLLIKEYLAITIAIVSTLALTLRFFINGEPYRYIISFLILSHSVSSFIKVLIDRKIYTQDYPIHSIKKVTNGRKV